MTVRIVFAAMIALAIAGCGVKSQLDRPSGEVMNDRGKNPARPPVSLGEPGGTLPPYPTGP